MRRVIPEGSEDETKNSLAGVDQLLEPQLLQQSSGALFKKATLELNRMDSFDGILNKLVSLSH